MNLYNIPTEIQNALDTYYSSYDEDGVQIISDEELKIRENILFELQNQKNELLEWYLKNRANSLSHISWIDKEIERLSEMKAKEEKKVKRLEKTLDFHFSEICKDKAVIFWNFSVSYTKSERTIIEDETKIPAKFKIKETKVTEKIPLKDIKEAIEKGEDVPGAKIEKVRTLKIK